MLSKREFLLGGLALGAVAVARQRKGRSTAETAGVASFDIVRSEEEWRHLLTPAQFGVLREHDTERPPQQPAQPGAPSRHLPLRRLRFASFLVGDQVRRWHGLAELLGAARGQRWHLGGPSPVPDPDGGALSPLRRTSRPRVRRRSPADRAPLLSERHRPQFRPGVTLSPAPRKVWRPWGVQPSWDGASNVV
jgi:hypothetical protein